MQRIPRPHLLRRCAAPWSRALLLLGLVGVGACVEATFDEGAAPDASSSASAQPQTQPDGRVTVAPGSPRDAGVPNPSEQTQAWWQKLAPAYALRIRFFGRERLTGTAAVLRHEIIMHARVTATGSGDVSMETERCSDVGHIDGILDDEFTWVHPERLPKEHFGLVLREGKVETVAEPRRIGYTDELPTGCVPGGQAPRLAEQVWLGAGMCDCATSALPLIASDCRMTDVDKDMLAGLTVHHSNFIGTQSVRVQDNCQIVGGEISSGGRIRGHYIESYDYLSLGCGSAPCVHNDIVVCPLELNPVWFEPLPDKTPEGGEWDCAAVLRASGAGKLFPTEMLSFPAGC